MNLCFGGIADIKREFCVERPDQVIDVLGLMGDTADNIPGAPGIGPKDSNEAYLGSLAVLKKYLNNTDKLKRKS